MTKEEKTREELRMPSWLTRRFICYLVFALAAGPALMSLLLTMGDQWLRNVVDDWMSGPEIFDALSIREDQYQELPLRWRQALAEIPIRDSRDAASLREFVKTLNAEDIGLLDRVATYALNIGGSIGIVRHRVVGTYPHLLPGLTSADFGTLESLGVIETSGYTITLPTGTRIKGGGSALVISLKNPGQTLPLNYTRFTDIGSSLMVAARKHTDLAYMEWVAQRIEKDADAVVEFLATGSDQDDVGRIDRSTIDALPMGQNN